MRFRTVLFLLLTLPLAFTCCIAQAPGNNSDTGSINSRIERRVRTTFQLPAEIDVTVGQRVPSEMSGYDKVPVIISNGPRHSTHDFLVSKDNKTIIEWEKLDIAEDIDVAGRPERGNKDAKITIVNYDDFECPFCARMHQTLFPDLMKIYSNQVKVIYKDYPLDFHPWALHAAVDANCLAAQNQDAYWDFADYAHANQKSISGENKDLNEAFGRLDKITLDLGAKHNLNSGALEACVKKQDETAVRASIAEGDKLGVDATPTMFINGEVISGIKSEEEMRSIIDRVLRKAGETPPQATASAGPAKPSNPAQ